MVHRLVPHMLLICCLGLMGTVYAFTCCKTVSPLSTRQISHRSRRSLTTTRAKLGEDLKTMVVNGDSKSSSLSVIDHDDDDVPTSLDSQVHNTSDIQGAFFDELTEYFNNITDSLEQLPYSDVSEQLSTSIAELATELERQFDVAEKQFAAPFEQLAFSDAPLFDIDKKNAGGTDESEPDEVEERKALQRKLILAGKNSTLKTSSRMRTGEIVKNFNVAPLYYSVALLYRWFQKASYPSLMLLSAYKSMANVLKTRGGPRRKKKKGELTYEEYIKDAEAMQSGWKRTGKIAAKGPLAKKWAILRRSLEVWAYFSSFYLKDRRIANKFQNGKWSEEKFREERSKLGMEVTQNLLRLGPTFIKVRT